MSDNKLAIGIDFGTSFSSIAQYSPNLEDKNKIQIFQDTIGENLISSTIFFESLDQILIGNEANYLSASENQYKIKNIKRYIGRCNEINTNDELYELLNKDNNNKYKLKLKLKKSESDNKIIEKEFYLEEICGLILKYLINLAENKIGQKINYAVISVPANFNNDQKKIIQNAAKIQGIETELIHEPTAAVLAFEFEKDLITEKNILVFDLGAGTLDVTILKFKEDKEHEKTFDIITTHGKNNLGGKNFDNYIFNYIFNDFTNKNRNENLILNYNNKIKCLERCERAKKLLNERTSVKIDLSFLLSNKKKLEYELTREKFISICDNLFKDCLTVIEESLKKGNMENNNINDIILIGGGTKIYNIKNIIKNKFPNINILSDKEPQLTVVRGAAIQAAINLRKFDKKIKKINCFDRIPMSIGIENKDGKMDIIFKKNSPLTLFSERNYSYDSETPLTIKLCAYEGENEIAKKNIKIGEYLFNLKPVNNKIEFKIKFFLENYILKVQKIQENNKDEEIIINDENNLSQNEINEINKNNLNKCLNTQNSVPINSDILSNILTLKNIINSTTNEKIKFENLYKLILKINELLNNLEKDLNKNQQYKNKYLIYFKDLLILAEQIFNCKSQMTDTIKKDIKKIIENVINISNKYDMNDEIYDFFDEIKDNDEFNNYFIITSVFKSYKSSRNNNKKTIKEASTYLNTINNLSSSNFSFYSDDLSKTCSEIFEDEKSIKSINSMK